MKRILFVLLGNSIQYLLVESFLPFSSPPPSLCTHQKRTPQLPLPSFSYPWRNSKCSSPSFLSSSKGWAGKHDSRPFPTMPSELFVSLAHSQMELLATSVPKIKSMALYLPQENSNTGQLEFCPMINFPHSDRVFIASGADSGIAPSLPKTLTKLPGFSHAASLLPNYPMVFADDRDDAGNARIGVVEEVMCDPIQKTSTLSVPLFRGSQTIGVFLLWPKAGGKRWDGEDRDQIARAAESLSLALSMDTERVMLQQKSYVFREQLSDALHQVKNPLQALRTYSKLLQQRVAGEEGIPPGVKDGQLSTWVKHLIAQSDRVADWLAPMDTIVNLLPASTSNTTVMAPPLFQMQNEREFTPVFIQHIGTQNQTYSLWDNGPSSIFVVETDDLDVEEAIEFTRDDSSVTYYASNSMLPLLDNPALDDDGEELEMGFVGDVLEPTLSTYKLLAADLGVRFAVLGDMGDLPGVWLSPKPLQEAVSNVLDNALKYVKVGTMPSEFPYVEVEMRPLEDEPGVSIIVRDNGPGIPEDETPNIFQRGYRGYRTRDKAAGSGIGLDIAQTLVQRMSGDLELIPSEEGAAFEFRLYRRA